MSKITKKIVAGITVLACAVMMSPGLTSALTAEELQESIDALMDELSGLQDQLTVLEGGDGEVTVEGCTITSFDRSLSLGATGDDVNCLQIVLNSDTETQLAESGVGSPGEETSYFGPLTKAGVVKFQELYAEDCLESWGLTVGTGYVGSTTLAKLNSLLTAGEEEEEEEVTCSEITDAVECVTGGCSWDAATETCSAVGEEEEEEEEEVTCSEITDAVECVTEGCSWDAATETCSAVGEEEEEEEGLTVSLADDTPVAQLVPAGTGVAGAAASNVAFTKVTFTGLGEVSKIVVTRGGVSTDASLTGVKLYDGDTQIGITQTFNALHQAVFNLTSPWEVDGTKTLTIAGDYTAGNFGQVILSIQSVSDITADVTVGGTFPIVGNPATGSAVDVGNLTVDNGSLQPVGGGTVDVDATNFMFMQMKLTAGAAEDIYVNAITIARGVAASFIDSDLTNIILYNDTAGVELGKVTVLGTNSKTTFSLATPLLIERGRFVEISIRTDILSGSTRNVAFDVSDGVAYTVLATGKSYGYGVALAAGSFLGFGPATQINRGILNVSKGANCPATGNIAVGSSDVELGSFNFKTRGEDIRVGRIIVSLERITVTAGRTAVTDLSLVKLVDSAGNVFAGPVTPTIFAATNDAIATFTTSLTLSPGNNEIFVVANTANNAALATCQFRVGFDGAIGGNPGGGVAITNVRGMTSNLPLVAGTQLTPAVNVLGNIMTAQQGALSADMAATPVAGNVILNSQGLTLANLNLDATASGEDIRVTSITLTEVGVGGTLQELSDIELWDGTTQVGLTMQPAAAPATTVTFTLTTPYVVSKGVSKTLAVKANLIAGTAAVDTHSFTVAFPVCTTTTGAPVGAVAPAATASPVQLVQNSGTLNVTVDASPVTSAQLVANTTDNEVVRYKFWAFDEDFDVTQVYVCASDTAGAGTSPASVAADIASVSLWMGGQQISGNVPVSIGVANAIAPSLVGLTSGTLVVPKNSSKVVSLKVSFNDKTSLTSDTDYQFGICDGAGSDAAWGGAGDYSIVATGSSSGQQIGRTPGAAVVTQIDDAAGNIAGGNNMEVFDGKLVVALNSVSPSGHHTPGANKEVMRIDLTAVGDDITLTGLTLTSGATYAFNNANDSVYLQSIDGTVTYDCSVTAVDSFDNGNTIAFPGNQVVGPCATAGAVWENALVIAEGTTTSIKVVGDTSGVPTVGQSLQLSILNALTDILWTDNNAVAQGGPGGPGALVTDLVGTKTVPLYGNTLIY